MFTIKIEKVESTTFDTNDKEEYIIMIEHVDDGNTHVYSDAHVRAGFPFNAMMPNSGIEFHGTGILFPNPKFGRNNVAVLDLSTLLDATYSDGSSNPIEIHLEVVSGVGVGSTTDVGSYTLYAQIQFDDTVTSTTTTPNVNAQSSIGINIVNT